MNFFKKSFKFSNSNQSATELQNQKQSQDGSLTPEQEQQQIQTQIQTQIQSIQQQLQSLQSMQSMQRTSFANYSENNSNNTIQLQQLPPQQQLQQLPPQQQLQQLPPQQQLQQLPPQQQLQQLLPQQQLQQLLPHQPPPQQQQQHQQLFGSDFFISFTTIEFFERFIRTSSELGLLRTPLPNPLTSFHIKTSSNQLIQAAGLDSNNIFFKDDTKWGTIMVTEKGIHQIQSYLAMKIEAKAATDIQKIWKGYITRKRVLNYFMKKSPSMKAKNMHPIEFTSRIANEFSREFDGGSVQGYARESVSEKKAGISHDLLFMDPLPPSSIENQVGSLEIPDTSLLEEYVKNFSMAYDVILNAHKYSQNGPAPSNEEVEFMKLLNHPNSFKVCFDYLAILSIMETQPKSPQKQAASLPDNQDTMLIYSEFYPKIAAWLGNVLKIQFNPKHDLMYILRSGDILCRLLVTLYPDLTCVLLQRGPEFGFHKLVFFLEFCKSLHIKRSLLFQVTDILKKPEDDINRKSALIVVRAIIAVEKHARKNGWEGPAIELKSTGSPDLEGEEPAVLPKQNENPLRETKSASPKVPPTRPLSIQELSFSSFAEELIHAANVVIQEQAAKKVVPVKPKKKKRGRPTPPSIVAASVATLTPILEDKNGDYIDNEESDIEINEETSQKHESNDQVVPTSSANTMKMNSNNEARVPDFLNFANSNIMKSPLMVVPQSGQPPSPKIDEKQLLQVIQERNTCIEDFLSEEQVHMDYLKSLVTYIDQLIQKRKTNFSNLSYLSDGILNETMMDNAPSFTFSVSPLPQYPTESALSYKFRLENEIMELLQIQQVVESMLGVHKLLLYLSKRSITELGPLCNSPNGVSCFVLSPCIMEYVNAIQTPYAAFAVYTLSNFKGNAGRTKHEEQVFEKVNLYVKSIIGSEKPELIEEPMSNEWQIFLYQTIRRLEKYQLDFDRISRVASTKIQIDLLRKDQGVGLEIARDDMKLRMACSRIGCIRDSITDHLLI